MRAATLLLVFAAVPLAACRQKTAADLVDPKWRGDVGDIPFTVGFKEGLAKAVESGKPPLLFFCTYTCSGCKALAAAAFKDAKTVELVKRNLTPIIVDLVGDDFASNYVIHVTPSVAVTDFNGRNADLIDGVTPQQFKDLVAKHSK